MTSRISRQYAEQQQQYAAAAAGRRRSEEDDATAQLEKYAKLHADGVLTDEEFASAKAKILGI